MLIDTPDMFQTFVNERVRLSFYWDFLYPLASHSPLEQFYREKAEGSLNEELHTCRAAIWNTMHKYRLRLLCLSPASFNHFGTTRDCRS